MHSGGTFEKRRDCVETSIYKPGAVNKDKGIHTVTFYHIIVNSSGLEKIIKIWYNFQMDRYQKLLEAKAKRKREFMGKMFFPRTPVLLLDFSQVKKADAFKDLLKGLEAIHLTTLIVCAKNQDTLPIGKYLRYLPEQAKQEAYEAADFAIMLDGNVDMAWEK